MYLTLFKVLSLVGSVFIYIQWVVPINGPVLGWMGGATYDLKCSKYDLLMVY